MEFEKKIYCNTFHHHFHSRNDTFKSLEFSPLTEKVLAGVIMDIRGVSGYLKLGGQVVMWRASILPNTATGWAIARHLRP